VNPIFFIDFYKQGHVDQYPAGTKQIWVNFTPRSSRVEGTKNVIFFGLQHFIKKVLVEQFNRDFFYQDWTDIETEYKEVIGQTLGIANPRTDHIRELYELGHLPIDIYALPEGSHVPLGVPAFVLTNTDPRFFWLPNYLETMMSNAIWMACTSATTARRYRDVFTKWATAAGETDLGFVDWMGHDFSYRGLSGLDAAVISGMGHLLSFSGTDTLPAILEARQYYGAKLSVGGSVPATEHSVMCAGGQTGELETFKRLITETYPSGIVSIVSDTWNLWDVLTKYIPELRPEIQTRDGKVVIRPDSGDPVKILTGDPDAKPGTPEHAGALDLLDRAVGHTWTAPQKYKLRKMGLIYGDSITVERADQILAAAYKQNFSPYNFVFGIGSYTYQYVTRDTYNFAFKATAVRRENGQVEAIFKNPVTDNAHKKSHRGIPVVFKNVFGEFQVLETVEPDKLDHCAFQKVFDGRLLVDQTFDEIRTRARA